MQPSTQEYYEGSEFGEEERNPFEERNNPFEELENNKRYTTGTFSSLLDSYWGTSGVTSTSNEPIQQQQRPITNSIINEQQQQQPIQQQPIQQQPIQQQPIQQQPIQQQPITHAQMISSLFKRGAEMAKTAIDSSKTAIHTHLSSASSSSPYTTSTTTPSSSYPTSSLNPRVFGVPLQLVPRTDRVPVIATECINFLNLHVDEVGLYRVSGSTREVNSYRAAFEEGRCNVFITDDYVDANAVASLFKAWVRELPECLLGDGVLQFQQLFASYSDVDTYFPDSIILGDQHVLLNNSEILQGLESLIAQWCSEEARDFLALFLGHLRKVSQKEAVNKMGLNNLQVVWSPTLRFGGAVFMMFVLHHDRLFPVQTPTVQTTKKAPALPPRTLSTKSIKTKPLPRPPSRDNFVDSVVLPPVRSVSKSPLPDFSNFGMEEEMRLSLSAHEASQVNSLPKPPRNARSPPPAPPPK